MAATWSFQHVNDDRSVPGGRAASGTGPNNPASVTRTGKEVDISTRLRVETGQHLGIAGFIISGSTSKKVIVRVLGPTLGQFGVLNILQDPAISLFDASNNLIASNDNWMTTQQTEIQASGFAPPNDNESAVIIVRPAAATTAIIRGKGNSAGNALVEAYILPP